jgi:hypothetical protein
MDTTRAGKGCGSCKALVKEAVEWFCGGDVQEDPSVNYYVPIIPLNKAALELVGNFLFDDFDDPVGARIDQNCTIVHNGVAIIMNAIFRRNVVIRHTGFRQNCTHTDVLVVTKGGVMPFGDIAVKARTLIDPEHSIHASDHTAHHATDNSADRTSCTITLPRTTFHSSWNALGQGR